MKKPNNDLIRLVSLGVISKVAISSVLVGNDSACTMCVLASDTGEVKGKWSTYEKYLDQRFDYRSVVRVKWEYAEEVRAWNKYESDNTNELAEYERLKAKYET